MKNELVIIVEKCLIVFNIIIVCIFRDLVIFFLCIFKYKYGYVFVNRMYKDIYSSINNSS